jgi:hypothetical protein
MALVAVSALLFAGVLVVAFTVSNRPPSACDGLFEQTTTTMSGSLEAISAKGSVFLGRAKVQELAEGVQKVGVYLKACCIVEHEHPMSADELNRCMSLPLEFELKLSEVAAQVSAADVAKKTGNDATAKDKSTGANAAADQARGIVRVARLGSQTSQSDSERTSPKSDDTAAELVRDRDVATDKATSSRVGATGKKSNRADNPEGARHRKTETQGNLAQAKIPAAQPASSIAPAALIPAPPTSSSAPAAPTPATPTPKTLMATNSVRAGTTFTLDSAEAAGGKVVEYDGSTRAGACDDAKSDLADRILGNNGCSKSAKARFADQVGPPDLVPILLANGTWKENETYTYLRSTAAIALPETVESSCYGCREEGGTWYCKASGTVTCRVSLVDYHVQAR